MRNFQRYIAVGSRCDKTLCGRYRRIAAAGLLVLMAGCEMEEQAKYKPYVENIFFADKSSARPRVPHTVPRESAAAGVSGAAEQEFGPAGLANGRRWYEVLCAPCHGISGYGDGQVVGRGFPAPPSLHSEAARNWSDEHLIDVALNGYGKSPPYKSTLSPGEARQVVAFMRALQLSQNARIEDVPPENRKEF